MATREQVFGSRQINGKIKTFQDNSRNKFLTGLFMQAGTLESFEPNRVEWDERAFSESLAPVIGFSEAPPTTKAPTEKNKIATMAKVGHVISIPGERLFYEREVGQLTPNAESVVADAIIQGVKKIENTVELLCALALLDNMTINSSVVPGTKAPFTFSFGNDTITATDWSVVSTLIASSKVKSICDQYRQNSGQLPGRIIINSTTESYLLSNTEIQALLANANGFMDVLKSDHRGAAVMNGLGIGNLLWEKHLGGYKPDETTWTEFVPTDKAIILPEDANLSETIAMGLGYSLIPSELWGSGGNAASQLERAPNPGLSVYSELKTQPMRVELVFEWVGMPLIKHPKGVLVASV